MDFSYGPPPPPPSRNGNGRNLGNVNSRNSTYNTSTLSNRGKNNRYSPSNTNMPSQANGQFNNNISLADLPTHLPNSITTAPTNPEVLQTPPAMVETSVAQNEPTPSSSPTSPPPLASTSKEPEPVADIINPEPEVESQSQPPSVTEDSTNAKEPVCIPGTSITLETEEDIRKWIEERKKKWPTRKNLEEKLKQEEAKKKESAQSDTNSNLNPNGKREMTSTNESNKKRRVCHFFQQNKKCRYGAKCKNSHELANNSNNSSSNTLPTSTASVVKTINNIQVNIPQRFKSEFYSNDPTNANNNNKSLFKMLVQKDHYENDNDTILQFLEYLDSKKLIDHNIGK
ncbi:hypothetical protein CAAN1_13S01332 [[Candida] anglica]|uniref:C3H1-type domain-containing protein n=1 Tax=[Candida] anglica TaxID=148631 RepID=A0ABP0EIE7_9ASCO